MTHADAVETLALYLGVTDFDVVGFVQTEFSITIVYRRGPFERVATFGRSGTCKGDNIMARIM